MASPTHKIATLPVVAIKLAERLNISESDVDEIVHIIKQDPSLAIRVLKVVNSSYYGMPRQVGSINQAVVLLGLNAIKSIAVVASFQKFFFAKSEYAVYARELWLHSIAVATASREVARLATDQCAEAVFLAGLTHDIGIIYQLQACPTKFAELVQFSNAHPGYCYSELEERFLGSNHESLGSMLCREWNLPEALEVTAGFHHNPTLAPRGHRTLTAIVHTAAKIAGGLPSSFVALMDEGPLSTEAVCLTGLKIDALHELSVSLPDKIDKARRMLGI